MSLSGDSSETKGHMTATRACVLGLVLLCAACHGMTTVAPSPTTNSIQVFSGTLPVHGTSVYTFNVPQGVSVNVTLVSLTVSGNPTFTLTTTVGLAVGIPSNTGGCAPTSQVTAIPALMAQLSIPAGNGGLSCVQISDVGNLAGTVNFAVRLTIAPVSNPSVAAFTEVFTTNLALNGTSTHAFYVAQAGTISVTLTSLSAPAQVGLGLGIPPSVGTGCLLFASLSTAAGSAPQITTGAEAGTYCVAVYDVGNLTTGTNFAVSIAYPAPVGTP
jgi:hypothetical protein